MFCCISTVVIPTRGTPCRSAVRYSSCHAEMCWKIRPKSRDRSGEFAEPCRVPAARIPPEADRTHRLRVGGAAVNGGRKLTPFQLKIDPLVFILRWSIPGLTEVAVFDAVRVAFESDDFGVVDEAVDYGGYNVVAEHFAPAAERLVAGDD